MFCSLEILKSMMIVLCHDIDSYLYDTKSYTTTIALHENGQRYTPWTQDVTWTDVRRSEGVLDSYTSHIRLIYVWCPSGE